MTRGRESARFSRKAGLDLVAKATPPPGNTSQQSVAIGALTGRKAAALNYRHSDACISPAVVLPPEPTRTIPAYAHQACIEGPASCLDGCLVDLAQREVLKFTVSLRVRGLRAMTMISALDVVHIQLKATVQTKQSAVQCCAVERS